MTRTLSIESRIACYFLAAIAPSYALAVWWIWSQSWPVPLRLVAAAGLFTAAAWIVFRLRHSLDFSVGTAASVVEALGQEDYAVRIQQFQRHGAFGDLLSEINTLAAKLQEHRLGSVESTVLLSKVLEEIDVAILGFDEQQRLRRWNRRAESILFHKSEKLSGTEARELGLSDWLAGKSPRIVDIDISGRASRWELRRGRYREGGEPRTLLFLSDLTPALREEERQAWQRLMQVLRHELNNSLTPIQSLASSLITTSNSDDFAARKDELAEGLDIILNRARHLNRFMSAYTRVATLPRPTIDRVCVAPVIRRIATLESRMEIQVVDGPAIDIDADGSQLEQVLINLFRNAVESALETKGDVTVSWRARSNSTMRNIESDGGPATSEAAPPGDSHAKFEHLEVTVDDTGSGFANRQNLFVPFYTTKPEGSGIGLVLSRRIVEAHGGTLTLDNRNDGPGCRATLRLPLQFRDAAPQGRE